MADFARIDSNNIVQNVYSIANEHLINEQGNEEEAFGIVYLNNTIGVGFTWVQTSKDNNFRKNFAGLGYTYDKTNDMFLKPQPYESWTLDASFDWQPPIAMPDDGSGYTWNEDTTAWDEVDMGDE